MKGLTGHGCAWIVTLNIKGLAESASNSLAIWLKEIFHEEIEVSVGVAMEQFRREVRGAGELLAKFNGYLVFPKVVKAGLGVDGSVALVNVGAGGSIDSTNIKDSIVAFVFGQKGLMCNLTLEGSKFTKLDK